MKKCNRATIVLILTILGVGFLASGCGGGTSGTSNTELRVLQGRVRGVQGAPLSNAQMSLLDSHSSDVAATTTDAEGVFSMEARGTRFRISLKKDSVASEVAVRFEFSSPSTIALDIQLPSDEGNGPGSALVASYEARARVMGSCKPGFIDNCSAEVDVRKDGIPVAGALLELTCGEKVLLATSTNSSGSERISVLASDETQRCLDLSVVVLGDLPRGLPIVIPLR